LRDPSAGAKLPAMRVAVILPTLPWPRDRGVIQMAGAYLDALSAVATVDAACLVDTPPASGAETAVAATVERLAVVSVRLQPWRPLWRQILDPLPPNCRHWFDPAAAEQVRTFFAGQHYDAALVFDLVSLAYARLALPGVPWWLARSRVDAVFHDLDQAVRPGTWRDRLRGRLLRRYERTASRVVAGQIVCAPSDRDSLARIVGTPRPVLVVPNGVDLAALPAQGPLPSTPAVLFVGAMDYPPNIDAVTWFARDIWSAIRAAEPAAEFRIVGRDPTAAVRDLASLPGISVSGAVPSVLPAYAAARVVVAPIRIAGGTRLKVVEAWALGRPLVATTAAVDGLAADASNTLRADDAASFARAVLRLLHDDAAAQALVAGARRTATDYDWKQVTQPVPGLIGGRHAR
jgi:glycosyltransferase involved in cell wall biosynthesis